MEKQTKHEQEYLHLPKRSFKYILSTLVLILITIFSIKILISSWNFLELGDLSQKIFYSYQLMILPLLVFIYVLISLTVCSFVNIFKKLKSYKEEGLIGGLIEGLIVGLFLGLIGGLIVGLFLGLIGGLVFGLVMGLISEFN